MGAQTVCLSLGWPSPDLSPNARVHWARKARATKRAKREGWLAARLAVPLLKVPPGYVLLIEWVFVPPNHRRFDDDNLLSRMKPHRDGIAQYLGVDDNVFRSSHRVATVPTPGGCVLVKLQVLPAPENATESAAYAENGAETPATA